MDDKPESNKTDKAIEHIYRVAKIGGAFFPPAAAFLELISPVIEKRQNSWIETLARDFERLKEEVEDFDIENLADNPLFISTLVNASRVAIATHIEEQHEYLRNAVLNSGLPEAPDETRQKMFIRLMDELSVWHIKILLLFEEESQIPSIKLSNPDWFMSGQRDKLADVIENSYPSLKGQYHLYLQIVNELYKEGLLTHTIPAPNRLSKTNVKPILSPFGKEFLNFIQSPINRAKHQNAD